MDLMEAEEKADVNEIKTAMKNVSIVNVVNPTSNLITEKVGLKDLCN